MTNAFPSFGTFAACAYCGRRVFVSRKEVKWQIKTGKKKPACKLCKKMMNPKHMKGSK